MGALDGRESTLALSEPDPLREMSVDSSASSSSAGNQGNSSGSGTSSSGGSGTRSKLSQSATNTSSASPTSSSAKNSGTHSKKSNEGKTLPGNSRANRRIVGTPDYLSPEILLGAEYGTASDWWALGVITYEFFIGTPPFSADDEKRIFDNIINHDVAWPDLEDIRQFMSDNARDFISRLLEPDPAKRLGAGGMTTFYNILFTFLGASEVRNHPWLEGIDWESLYSQPMDKFFVPNPRDHTDTDYFVGTKPE